MKGSARVALASLTKGPGGSPVTQDQFFGRDIRKAITRIHAEDRGRASAHNAEPGKL